jgi:transposase
MKISTIGVDLAKNVFAVHGIDGEGQVVVKRNLRRGQVLKFFAGLEPCLVGMEASSGAHYWARELRKLGHDARLMPASYVKAYVKRGKTDAVDAEACCEAVTRPTMRFVPVKTVEQQGLLSLHRARDLLVRQRTQATNALRALCAEFGIVAAKGRLPLASLAAMICDGSDERLEQSARLALKPVVEQTELLSRNIALLERQIQLLGREEAACRRLMTIPGVGPMIAHALVTTVGDVDRFACGRHLSSWIGLTAKPHSTGGKQKLGHISKQGDRYLRKLFVQGAVSLIRLAPTSRRPIAAWIRALLARRPAKVVAIAIANKLARIAWAVLAKNRDYSDGHRVELVAA